MTKVLVIHFSQTGQLADIVSSIAAPLENAEGIEVSRAYITPRKPYPFPWPFWKFFNTFPETVYEDAEPVDITGADLDADYDLVILGYQVWFLSPSLPATAFLDSPEAAKLLKDRPVITVIGCRNMWLMAQERMKERLTKLGARLIDNVVLIDSAHSAFTFVSTPLWMLTGNRGPWLGGRIPEAGISRADIDAASRFGEAIERGLHNRPRGATGPLLQGPLLQGPLLQGLGAVRINDKLIGSEVVAKRSFKLWGGLLRAIGKPSNPLRVLVLGVYVLFLITLILTVVPLLAVIKKLLSPLTRAKIAKQRAYYAAPSGESRALLEPAE
jgi:hypothetical protein